MLKKCFLDRCFLQIAQRSISGGFVGYNGLEQAEDFRKITRAAIHRTDELVVKIQNIPIGPEVIGAFDEISDSVCSVADVANFCFCVHPNEKWRNEARHAFHVLIQYISGLNTNQELYSTLKASLQTKKSSSSRAYWSQEALIVGNSLYRDFVSSGIGSDKKKTIQEMIAQEHELGSQFQKHVAQHSELNALSVKDTTLLPTYLQNKFMHYMGQYHLPMTPAFYHYISHSVDQEWIRKEAYLAHFTSLSKNRETLDRLLEVRRKWAMALNWESFVSFKLQDSIVVNPSSVEYFLQTTFQNSKEPAKEEIQSLEKMKGAKIFPWDIAYFTKKSKLQKMQDHGLSEPLFFRLKLVINGLNQFLSECMHVNMTLDNQDSFLWCDSIEKFTFWDSSREMKIGDLYLDLFERKDKVPENAHYTLRCGRLLSDGTYQTPIVALVTNFASERISFYELKTLMHEFGHVLHSLLSRTHFQHLFGTRGPLDLVEIPSHFFENLIQSPEGLQYFAGLDEQTNKLFSLESLRQTIEVNTMFQNLRILDQVQIAMIDQKLHGKDFHQGSSSISTVVEEIISSFGVLPYVANTCREAWLTHLVSYGGRYYSYVYSRYVANLAWTRNIDSNILDKQRWGSIQKRLFKPGGAINPQEYVQSLIGKTNLKQHNKNGWIPSM